MENSNYLDHLQEAFRNPLQVRTFTYTLTPEGTLSAKKLEALSNLEELHLYNANDLLFEKLDLGAFPKLLRLYLRSGTIKEMPAQVYTCNRLEELYIWQQHIKSLPKEIEGLKSLKKLHLKGLRYLRYLPETLWHLPALELLQIEKCPLKELPEIAATASQLQKLVLKNTKVKHLPVGMGKLSALQTLTLRKSPIEKLSEELLALPLQKITLSELPFLDILGQKGQQVASLWKLFAKKQYSFTERKAFFYLFLGLRERF